jgi:hypothetical protein
VKNSRRGAFPAGTAGRSFPAALTKAAPLPAMDSETFDPAAARTAILGRIAIAARAAGREPADVSLTAVCKQQPWERVAPVLAAGQRSFGENRVQEAQARWGERRGGLADLELRLIGPLQTNKAAEACALFHVIETLDRPKLARALAEHAQKAGASPRLFVQVNTGEEPQKAGVAPAEADAFIREARETFGLPVEGLMCIPPEDEEPAMHFALLAKIARRNGVSGLSMGMSGDFETAVRFGATSVRVGSALFGHRAAAP